MNLLLADVQPTQWILLGVIALLIICYPIFIVYKNKKEQQKVKELTDSIKVGKEVLTSSGVYGTIVNIEEKDNCKIVTLETGSEGYKSYIAFDVLAIYTVLNPDPPANAETKEETKESVEKEQSEVNKEETEEEVKEVKQEDQDLSNQDNEK